MRHVCTGRGGVVSTSDGLVVSVVVKWTMSSGAVGRSDSGASHVGIVAGAVVTSTRSESSVPGGGGSGNSRNFRVAELVALLALPELVTRALGVAVVRARAEALLLLVVTTKENLNRDGDEEEETRFC